MVKKRINVMIKEKEIKKLEEKCLKFRRDVIDVLHEKKTGHPGGSLSVCEILTTLLFHQMKNLNPANPLHPDRDRLILSKGHAAPMLYRGLAELGYFPVEEMHTLRDFGSRLQGHPCMLDTPGVDMTSGPLGIGLSASIGIALAFRLDGRKGHVYTVLGDGELNEGTIWEAAMSAAKFKIDNITAIVDWNRVQLDGTTDDIMPMGNIADKFKAFGWNVLECDGHCVKNLCDCYDKALAIKGVPTVILAHTIKGKGVSVMEGKSAWHGKPIDEDTFALAMEELGGR